MVQYNRLTSDDALINYLKNLEQKIDAQATKGSGDIVVSDPDTGVETILGTLPDGTTGLQQFVGDVEPPPVTTAPTVSAQPGNFVVSWDGLFLGGMTAPRDFVHVNVIGHKMDGATVLLSMPVGVIRTHTEAVLVSTDVATGGETWTFTLASEDYNGNVATESAASAPLMMIDALSVVDAAWTDLKDDVAATQQAAQTAQDAAQAAQDAADQVAADQTSSDAAIAAAQLKADQAFNAATAASTAAGNAQTSADSKNRNWYQDNPPAGSSHKLGDTWFDTNDGNKIYLWSGSPTPSWTAFQDSAIGLAQTAANNAATAASGAQTTATNAQTAAGNAATAASTAQTEATTAKNNAATADAKAAQAISDALTANNLAASKGKVLIQGSAPTGADANAQTLWIDTTGGANTPKRWVSGTTWNAVTDKVAVDAASAAASAASAATTAKNTADTAVTNAATAQSKADQAFANAASAATAAGNAQTSADSKNRIWYQPAPPAGTGHKINDTWFDTDDGNKLYVWSGTTPAWNSAQDAGIGLAQTAANNAATAATNAQTTATNAQTAAGNAATAASTAQTQADTAKTNAATADAKAVQALSDALAANNLAATKGKVLYQTSAPTGVDANAQTLWIDTTGGTNTPKRWVSGTTWNAVTDKVATDAAALAGSKGKILFQTSAPTGADASALTLWIDTTNGANTPKKWVSGTTWAAITDKTALDAATAAANAATAASDAQGTANTAVTNAATAQTKADQAFANAASAATAAGNAQTSADSKNRIWYQTTPPAGTGHKLGDTWFDTDDGNKIYLWSGATPAWNSFQDAGIATAQSAATSAASDASAAQSRADQAVSDALAASNLATSKGKVLYQTSAPTGADANLQTLWIDTTGGANTPKRWVSGVTWNAVTDKVATDAAALAASKGKVLVQSSAPTGADANLQTLWIDTTNGANTPMKWVSGTTWNAVTDKTATDAASLAASKGKVLVQGSAPTGTDANLQTLWIDTTNGANTPKKWVSGTTWTAVTDKVATDAASLAATKGKVLIQSNTPVAADQLPQNLWIDTTANANTPKKWNTTTSLWDVVTDKAATDAAAAAVAAQNTATAAQNLAGTANSTATDALTAANGKSAIYFSASSPSGVGTKYGDIWFKRDGTGTIIGQWEWVQGTPDAWQIRTISETVLGNISAGKIVAGWLVAGEIKSGSITADKLTISDFTNLLDDPDFNIASGNYTGWVLTAQGTIVSTTGVEGSTTNALKIVANGTINDLMNKNVIPTQSGEKYYGEIYVKQDGTGTTGDIQFSTTVRLADGSSTYPAFQQVTATSIGTAWTKLSGVITMPANAVTVQARVSVRNNATNGIFYFEHATMRRQALATTIANGAITTNHITVGTLDASVLVAGSVTTPKLAAKSVTVDKLLVTSTENIIQEADFSGGGASWELPAGFAVNATAGRNSLGAMVITNSAALQTAYSAVGAPTKVPIEYYSDGGNAYRLTAWVNSSVVVPTSGAYISARFRSSTGATTIQNVFYMTGTPAVLATIPANTWTEITGTVTAPADTISVSFSINSAATLATGTIKFDSVGAIRASTGELIVDGAITATKIAAEAVTTASMKSGTIDAGVLTAGSITAPKIAAKSIGVDKLLVSSTDNLIQEADFSGNGASWELPAGFAVNTTAGRNSLAAMVVTNSAALQTSYNASGAPTKTAIEFPSNGGNAYRISAWVNSSVVVPASGAYVTARFRSSTGTTTTQNVVYTTGTPPVAATIAANTWTEISGIVTAPANTISVAFSINSAATLSTGTIKWDLVAVTRAADGNLIVDGAITATKIGAEAVTTTSMKAGTIDAGVLVAGSITSPLIKSKSIGVDKLLVSSTDNLIMEADFSNNGTSWQISANKFISPTAGRSSQPAMRFTGLAGYITTLNLNNKIPISPDVRYRGSMWVKSSAASLAGAFQIVGRFYTTLVAYTDIVIASSPVMTANTWTNVEGIVPATIPSNAIAAEFYISVSNAAAGDTTDIDFVSVTRAADGKLIVDGAITSKKLTTDLVLSTNIIAGDPNGIRAEMTPDGFHVWTKSDINDPLEPAREAIKMGTSDNDFFAIIKADGTYASTLSEDGKIAGDTLAIKNDIEWKGNSLTESWDALPKGVIAWGSRSDNAPYWADTNYQPYLSLSFEAVAGRAYRVWTGPISMDGDAITALPMLSLHLETGAQVTTASTRIAQLVYDINGSHASRRNSLALNRLIVPQVSGTYSLLISYGVAASGTGRGRIIANTSSIAVHMCVDDIGLAPAETGESPNGTADGATTNPTPPPSKVNYVKTYYPTSSRSFQGNGSPYDFDSAHLFSGLSPAGYGDLRSMSMFSGQIATDVGSGTITKVRVYAYYDHWYNNSGGTADLTVYAGTSIPGSLPTVSGVAAAPSTGWPKPGGRWITIPSTAYAAIKNGTSRGIQFGGKGRGYLGYGYLHDVRMEVSYTK